MKRMLFAATLMVMWAAAAWADSPLTSTNFSQAYDTHPMVEMAAGIEPGDFIPTTILNFLCDKDSPIDVRLAVINKLGWKFEGNNMAQQLGERVSPETEIPVSVVLLPDMSSYLGDNHGMAPRLYLSADSVVLGMVNGKLQKKATITVGNMGQSVLNISSLQLFTSGVTVTLDKQQLKPQETATMKLTIDRDVLLTARSRPRVLMITNDPKRPKVAINIIVK